MAMISMLGIGRVEKALRAIKRRDFVLPKYKDIADLDEPLPIGHGQTISQPTTVRLMLEWLDARQGDHVLDIGSGSGWSTALLAHIVGPTGHVYGIERVPELVVMGERNCERLGLSNVSFYQSGDAIGLPGDAPFNGILVSAAADYIPETLCEQVARGGKLVMPVHNTIFELTRDDDCWQRVTHPGFVFVPLL